MKTRRVAGGAAIVFGLLTVVSGGRALFGTADMGAVVPFVLWFNFLAGFAYVLGGMLLAVGHRLALPLALAILIATAAVFAAFGWRALSGGAFEMRTVGAMTLRTLFWAMIVWLVRPGKP
jgi:uncharacterized membrane protein